MNISVNNKIVAGIDTGPILGKLAYFWENISLTGFDMSIMFQELHPKRGN